jgi:hypothetical protein
MASLLPQGKQYYETSAGVPLVGGKVYTYDAGTSNPRVTYQDSAATQPNTNPVILDARGEAVIFWSGSYKVVLKDALDNTIWTVDNVSNDSELLRQSLASSASSAVGAGLIGWIRTAAGAVAKTVWNWMQWSEISAFDFMTDAQVADVQARTRTLDVSTPMQNFFNACSNKTGRMPAGDYLCNTALIARAGMTIRGEGINATRLVCTSNINQVTNDPAGTYDVKFSDLQIWNHFPVSDVAGPSTTASTTLGSDIITVASTAGMQKGIRISGTGIPAGSYIRKISGTSVYLGNSAGALVNATATNAGVAITTLYRQGPTNFQFYIKNGGKWLLDNVMFFTDFTDNDYAPSNAAGCWFDRDAGAAYFVNTVRDCWFHHSQLLMGTSDSDIENCTIWSNPFDYAVKLSAPGIRITGGSISAGVICGVWTTATGTEPSGASNHSIGNVNIDSGDLWYVGYGAKLDQPVNVRIAGSTRFINNRKAGVIITDSVGCSIEANFLNGNQDGLAYSDVEVVSTSFQTTNLKVSGNFTQTNAKSPTPGWAIREVNSGFYPAFCNYSGCVISANYIAPLSIATPAGSSQRAAMVGMSGSGIGNVVGNLKVNTSLEPYQTATDGQIALGDNSLILQTYNNTLAAAGTLDLTVNTETFLGNPGGFAGILCVSATRNNAATQSRRAVYVANAYGATGVFTLLAAAQDGAGGGVTFTLTMGANGVIRYTDTSGQITAVRLTFIGSKSEA